METTTKVTFADGHTIEVVDANEVEPIKPVANVKKCKACGEILPLDNFRMGRYGRVHVCNKCTTAKRRVKKEELLEKQQQAEAMYDAMFIGMQPYEVLQIMGRAKKWLESRGYEIVLRGSLTVKKEVKFE